MAGNGNSGRTRKPKETKRAHGTLRPDREPNDAFEPEILWKLPPIPKRLKAEGRKVWRATGKQLVNNAVLGKVDMGLFAHYCYLFDICDGAQQSIDDDGMNIEMENKGGGKYMRKNPALETYQNALKEIRQLAPHFGVTPATRAKVPRANQDNSNNDWRNSAGQIKSPQLKVS